MRRATPGERHASTQQEFLSTLSLRRATRQVKQTHREKISISIHALLAESDNGRNANLTSHRDFYPRSPCGERQCTPSYSPTRCYFYPRSPCGERQDGTRPSARIYDFYPRSPCGERLTCAFETRSNSRFLSTLSLRRATGYFPEVCSFRQISIHALLAESDQPKPIRHNKNNVFLSTLSLRRATASVT